jgi:hypothetical protein
MDNWGAFERYNTYSLTDKQRFKELYSQATRAGVAEKLTYDKKYALVLEHNGAVHVSYASDEGMTHSYSLDELPIHIKQGLAVLKLCDKEKLLDGVGVRTDDNVFVIFTGDDNA